MALKKKTIVINGLAILVIVGVLNYKIEAINYEQQQLKNEISNMNEKINQLDLQIELKKESIKKLDEKLEELNRQNEEIDKYKNTVTKVKSLPYNVYESEVDLIERVVYCEARGESEEGQIAVVNVILNRLKDDNFPNTVTDIIYQKNQFSPVSNGAIWKVTPDEKVKQSVQKALQGTKVISDESVYFFAKWIRSDHPIRSHVEILETVGVHHFGKFV